VIIVLYLVWNFKYIKYNILKILINIYALFVIFMGAYQFKRVYNDYNMQYFLIFIIILFTSNLITRNEK
ncbi:MAG: hypothetical protein ACFFG0_35125, partial [Candidatus Thorarchaeota archaeon]